MFCDILGQREKKKTQAGSDSPGSEFITIFESLLDSIAYDGESTSCKQGIAERIILDAAMLEVSEDNTQEIKQDSYQAMQSYHLFYLNSFYNKENKPSTLLCDIATFIIAKQLSKRSDPES